MGNENRHIAFYIGSLSKGGAERVFVNLAEYFLKEGCRVTMVTQYRKENEYALPAGANRVISDITPQEEGGRIGNFFRRFGKLRRIFAEIRADVVLSAFGKNNLMAICTNAFLPTKVVVSVVAEPTEEYAGGLMRFLAKTLFYFADGIVMQTREAVRFFPKSLQKKCVILKNSVNPSFVRPRFDGIRKQEIVAVGRVDANKNHRMAIRAFALIADRFPDSSLTIYGEGELRQELLEEAGKLGMEDRIRMPGAVADVADRIEKAYAFVLTSFSEGMPNTLLEAMCLGLPCISTDCPCGGPRDLIEDGMNGFLVPVGDEGALAMRLSELLGDLRLAEEMGKRAALLQQDYLPGKVNESWKDYFARVVGKKL